MLIALGIMPELGECTIFRGASNVLTCLFDTVGYRSKYYVAVLSKAFNLDQNGQKCFFLGRRCAFCVGVNFHAVKLHQNVSMRMPIFPAVSPLDFSFSREDSAKNERRME
jgi:hypothetical protein